MIKKVTTYTDYNGVEHTDEVYFNLTKVELAKLQVRDDGKYLDNIRQLAEGNHVEELFNFFEQLVLDAYGEKSPDGLRFVKDYNKRCEFEESIAFSEILSELITDPEKMSEFTRKVIPPDMLKKVTENEKQPTVVHPVN